MFDTEEEAAEAYMTKARRYQHNSIAGRHSSLNRSKCIHGSNDDGINSQFMYQNLVHRLADDPISFVRENNNQYDSQNNIYSLPKCFRVSSSSSSSLHQSQHSSVSNSEHLPNRGDLMTSFQAKLMWERLMSIYQRVLLAKAVTEKLTQLQTSSTPNQQREMLLKNLREEIAMLSVVQNQLEEAVTQYFIREVSLIPSLTATDSLDGADGSSRTDEIDHMTFDLPLDPIETAVFPLTHLTTPLQNLQNQSPEYSLGSLLKKDTLSEVNCDIAAGAKEMQDLQHLIELQQSSMKSTKMVE